jgi:MFS family permease
MESDAAGSDGSADVDRDGKGATIIGRLRSKLMTHTFESLKIRDFRVLWFGFMGSWTGMQFQQVARGYLAYRLTGSAFAIGLVTLAMGLPRIVLSPIGGYLADRFKKRDVIIWTSLPMTALSGVTGVLYLDHQLTVTWLVVLGFLQGIAFYCVLTLVVARLMAREAKGGQGFQ